MKKLALLLIPLFFLSIVNAACETGQNLTGWTNVGNVSINTWDMQETDEFGDPLYPGSNITSVKMTLDRNNLYFKFELNHEEQTNEQALYSLKIYPNSGEINYFEFNFRCNNLIGVFKKPHTGAIVNITASSNWEETKELFNISAQEHSMEIAMPLDFINNPSEIGFELDVYYDSQNVNNISPKEWSFYICTTTDMVCGDGVCELWEGYATHPCVCPSDCPEMDTSCMHAVCGDGYCDQGEAVSGSACECEEDCEVFLTPACDFGESITDWSESTLLQEDDEPFHEGLNGTDLSAIRAKADGHRLWIKIELESGESPHENITYNLRIRPEGISEYVGFKMDCSGLYEVVERYDDSPLPINYTSLPSWQSIKEKFNVSLTHESVEIEMPWYAIYRPSNLDIEIKTMFRGSEKDHLWTNIDEMTELFLNTCGDGICTQSENNSYNWYKYCPRDCPNAEPSTWNNGVCDEGEDERWSQTQFFYDCPEVSGEYGGKPPINEYPGMEGPRIPEIIITIMVLGIVGFGGFKAMQKIYLKATSGKRKKKDLKKRKKHISKERKELEQKFLDTKISEDEFHKKMTELDREEQNIDLELKK